MHDAEVGMHGTLIALWMVILIQHTVYKYVCLYEILHRPTVNQRRDSIYLPTIHHAKSL